MPASPVSQVIHRLRNSLLPHGADLTDGQLLECFVSHRDTVALETLVWRHAPMVWGVCRRVLENHHDAEDACQAAFLVLVRKAAAIRTPAQLANWLYGVAHQTARKARATRARRQARERALAVTPEPAELNAGPHADLLPLLDQELSRLPEKYRTVIVLCELEGRSGKEVACQLNVPQGTVASRLSRARAMLARRLSAQGVAVSGSVLIAVLASIGAAAAPASVVSSTIAAVTAIAAGHAAAHVVSLKVATLAERMVRAMLLTKLTRVMLVMVALAAVVGFGTVLYRAQAAEPAEPGAQPPTPPLSKPQVQTEQKSKVAALQPDAGQPVKPTADRVKLVRQMYSKLPCDILDVSEPIKQIVVTQKGISIMVLLEDAKARKFEINLLPKLGKTPDAILLPTGKLPPRGPEESAVYGLLLRLAAKPPEKTMPIQLQHLDAILAALDERFAGAMPIPGKD